MTKGEGSAPAYAILDSADEVSIRGSVTFYDQYGNTTARGYTVEIDIGTAEAVRRTVSSRGVASYRADSDGTAGNAITVGVRRLFEDTDEQVLSMSRSWAELP